jgi:hypothetical protein
MSDQPEAQTPKDTAPTRPTAAEIVKLDPSAVDLEPICFNDDQALELAHPKPSPPLIKDPTKGSNAQKVPNYSDAAYLRSFSAWNDRLELLRFLVAAGVTLGGLDWATANRDGSGEQWCTGMINTVGSSASSRWVNAAIKRLEEVSLPELVADAAKNSSAP